MIFSLQEVEPLYLVAQVQLQFSLVEAMNPRYSFSNKLAEAEPKTCFNYPAYTWIIFLLSIFGMFHVRFASIPTVPSGERLCRERPTLLQPFRNERQVDECHSVEQTSSRIRSVGAFDQQDECMCTHVHAQELQVNVGGDHSVHTMLRCSSSIFIGSDDAEDGGAGVRFRMPKT